MKYKTPLKHIFLKGEEFVPESLVIEQGNEVCFSNENRSSATIQSKGSLSVTDFVLGFGKRKTLVFEKEGRFLFQLAADTSITCTIEVRKSVPATKKLQPLFVTSTRKEVLNGTSESKDETQSQASKNFYLKFSESLVSPPRKTRAANGVEDIETEEVEFIRQQRQLFKSFKSASVNISSFPSIPAAQKNMKIAAPNSGSEKNTSISTFKPAEFDSIEHLLLIEDYAFVQPIATVYVGDTVTFALATSTKAHVEHSLKGDSSVAELCFESGLLQINSCRQYSFQPTKPGEIQVACEVDPDTKCLIDVKEKTAPRIKQLIADGTGLTAVATTKNDDNIEKVGSEDDSFYDSDDNLDDDEVEQQHPQSSSFEKVPADKDFIVGINESGFRPSVIRCQRGDIVKFIAETKHWFCTIACDGVFRDVFLNGDDDHPIYQAQFEQPGIYEVYNQDFHWIICRIEVTETDANSFTSTTYDSSFPSFVPRQLSSGFDWLHDLDYNSTNFSLGDEIFSGSLAPSLITTATIQTPKPTSPGFTHSNTSPILKQTEALRLFGSFLPSKPNQQQQSQPNRGQSTKESQYKVSSNQIDASKDSEGDSSGEDFDDEDEAEENENTNASNMKAKSKGSKTRMMKKRKQYKKKKRQKLRKEEREQQRLKATQPTETKVEVTEEENILKPAMLNQHAIAMADWSIEFDELAEGDDLATTDEKSKKLESPDLNAETIASITHPSADSISPYINGQRSINHCVHHMVAYDLSEDGSSSSMSSFDPADDCGPFLEFANTDDEDSDDDVSEPMITPVKTKPYNQSPLQTNDEQNFNQENKAMFTSPNAVEGNVEDSNRNDNNLKTPDFGIITNKRDILFSALGLKTPNTTMDISHLVHSVNDVVRQGEEDYSTECENDEIPLLAYEDGQSTWSEEEDIPDPDKDVIEVKEPQDQENKEQESSVDEFDCSFESPLREFFLKRINAVHAVLQSNGCDRFPGGRTAQILRWEDIPYSTPVESVTPPTSESLSSSQNQEERVKHNTPKSSKKKSFYSRNNKKKSSE